MSNSPETAGLKKDEDEETAASSEEASDADNSMPLFKYARLVGSLPRVPKRGDVPSNPFSSPCTCAAMGKVILAPEVLEPSNNGADGGMALSNRQSDLVWNYPHYVLAMGFQTGQLSLVDAKTGVAIVPSEQLKESKAESVVDVAFDASGTHLAAMYASGMCAIWELRYAASSVRSTSTTSTTTAATAPESTAPTDNNVFASFLTNLKGSTPQAPAGAPQDSPQSTVPILTTSSAQPSRISYPASFGRPTCMAIDPYYKRRREKTIMAGFLDGRLVITKRGFFSRRNDVVIYQGTSGEIEAIEWRGTLVAWADASGIKLFDVDNMTRIAHIDRPAGARATLYPTIAALRPTLVFETSDHLLCTWGDCLMALSIKEQTVSARSVGDGPAATTETSAGESAPETSVMKRRTVQCTMAWELDFVACGVAPLDKDHVAVLGLVPIFQEGGISHNGAAVNDMELHVMSRSEGTVIYADVLPLIPIPQFDGKESASGCMLLSSFALPRMEDTVEAEEERAFAVDEQEIDFQLTLFSPSTKAAPFKDPHLKWSLEQLAFEDDNDGNTTQEDDNSKNGKVAGEDGDQDDQSVDSDDYSFVVRPSKPSQREKIPSSSVTSPLMVIASPTDAVLVRTREVDDAVSHALSANKFGLALRRALTYKRQLREYDINQLIDEYLSAVLRMKKADEGKGERLSIRRVKLAAEAMPMLLGGNIRMWERWIGEFSKIPGGLFVLREQLPVRDPILPAKVYESVMQAMFSEIEGVLMNTGDESLQQDGVVLYPQMMRHFLSALSAWGPSRSLRDKIQFHKYNEDRQRKKSQPVDHIENAVLLDTEKSLQRRMNQTSSGYLQLVPHPSQSHPEPSGPPAQSVDDTSDSLYTVDDVLAMVTAHVPLMNDSDKQAGTDIANNHAALEAMAELEMMKGSYEVALRCFLLIGCLHVSPDLSNVEEYAVLAVNSEGGGEQHGKGINPYGFVVAMIEYKHLHQCLLEEDFLSSSLSEETDAVSSPLVALIQLVGLDDAGDFLVEHCVPPPANKSFSSGALSNSRVSDANEEQNSNENLPINLVADQLRPHPKLFHWYLHQIFTRRPEMYVKFPRTAVPPRPVTELHRSHLELYIEHTDKRDSAKSLAGTETYNLDRMTTPLLLFLKAALPLGGIRPDEVRRLLEAERTGNKQGIQSDVVQFPHYFALELAYVIENFGKGTEEDAQRILDLYLNGSKSLMLAVSYSQRNTEYGPQLWATLIDHCLNSSQDDGTKSDGSLFGTLLECAALCGADLAHLVTQIPQGMKIEGLRPRLVAAVADYRWKLKMHEAASGIGTNERIMLLRELAHRSRRGMRFSQQIAAAEDAPSPSSPPSSPEKKLGVAKNIVPDEEGQSTVILPSERPNRYRLSFAVPIR